MVHQMYKIFLENGAKLVLHRSLCKNAKKWPKMSLKNWHCIVQWVPLSAKMVGAKN